jgi:hypothetical protein
VRLTILNKSNSTDVPRERERGREKSRLRETVERLTHQMMEMMNMRFTMLQK